MQLGCYSVYADDAKDLYARGVSAFDAGRYIEAADLFRAAQEAKASWKLHFNIGQCLAAAKEYGGALESFEKYLSQGGDEIPDARMAEVMKELSRLRELVGYVRITAPDGAQVMIDDSSRGNAPLAAEVPLAIGVEHTVKVVIADAVEERRISVRVGATTVLEFGKKEEAASEKPAPVVKTEKPTPAPVVAPGADDSARRLKTAGWITAGAGAAVLIAGGVVGGVALSKDKALSDSCSGTSCDGADWNDAQKMKNMGIAADVMFGVGGAALATGIVLLIVSAKKESAAQARVSVSPVMTAEYSGAVLTGEF